MANQGRIWTQDGSNGLPSYDSIAVHYSEADRLVGRYGATSAGSNVHPTNSVNPARRSHGSLKILFLFVFFAGGLIAGYVFNGFYNYSVYEKLWRDWAKEEIHRTTLRKQWAEEVERHELRRLEMNKEEAKWRNEKEARDAERKRWEDEQRSRRADLLWQDLRAGHCLRYATREYTATLSNIPPGMDAPAECAKKSIEIHGRAVLPTYCGLEGPCGRITGHWNIDFDEAGCTPWWGSLQDKGCDVGMHKHRYEARLSNLQTYHDWEVLCKSTPATINGVLYEGATSCIDSVWGKFGVWFVEDGNCR